jgi:glucokinase
LTLLVIILTPIIYFYVILVDSGTIYTIPPMKPSIQDAAPEGFKENSSRRILQNEIHSFEGELKNRFFSSEGPTSVYGLIDTVDSRTNELNKRSPGRECISSEPVMIEVNGWSNETLKIWIQCYEQLSNDLFLMFGKKDDILYLYERGTMTTITSFIHLKPKDTNDESPCCFQVNGGGDDCRCESNNQCLKDGLELNGGNCRTTNENWPTNGTGTSTLLGNSTLASVNIYFSVGGGYTSSQSGSRGLMHLEAQPKYNKFQASVAGIGIGYCGVQFASNGEKLHVIGSVDGPGKTCKPTNQTCVSSDLTTRYDISECNDINFSINPLGRTSSIDFQGPWNASHYPQYPNVDISNVPLSPVHYGPNRVPLILGTKHKF